MKLADLVAPHHDYLGESFDSTLPLVKNSKLTGIVRRQNPKLSDVEVMSGEWESTQFHFIKFMFNDFFEVHLTTGDGAEHVSTEVPIKVFSTVGKLLVDKFLAGVPVRIFVAQDAKKLQSLYKKLIDRMVVDMKLPSDTVAVKHGLSKDGKKTPGIAYELTPVKKDEKGLSEIHG